MAGTQEPAARLAHDPLAPVGREVDFSALSRAEIEALARSAPCGHIVDIAKGLARLAEDRHNAARCPEEHARGLRIRFDALRAHLWLLRERCGQEVRMHARVRGACARISASAPPRAARLCAVSAKRAAPAQSLPNLRSGCTNA